MRRSSILTRLVLAAAVLALALTGCGGSSREPAEGSTTIDVDGTPVHAIRREGARRPGPVITVLFLHGQAYDSRIWDDRGLIDAVTGLGHLAVAVDLPGHGDTPDRQGGPPDGTWLRDLIEQLGGPGEVVLVSPSMSGRYSLDYLSRHPSDRLAGFVPVAPVGIDDYTRPPSAAPVPTLAIWGSKDPSYSVARTQRLVEESRAPDGESRSEVIDGASHACYDDHPEAFRDLLVGFLGRFAT